MHSVELCISSGISCLDIAPVMKIAHVQHPFFPGLGYQENHLPAKQRTLGHDARIFTSDYVPTDSGREQKATGLSHHKDVPVHRLNTRGDIASVGSVGLKELRKHLEQFDPDILHSHGLYSLYTIQNLRYDLTADVDFFVDVHIDNDNFHVDTVPKQLGFHAHRFLLLPLLRRSTEKFLPVNPYASQFLAKDLRLSETEIELLPLGVDTDVFSPSVKPGDLRSQLGITKTDRVLISSGNLNETKDLDVLVKAFSECASSHSDAHLLIVGPGPESYLCEIRGLVDDLGLGNRVTFQGAVPHDELPKYYNLADVGIWPGKLGITILEAIGCGLPVIVCDSVATEFLIAGGNGRSVKRGDVPQLAATIDKLLSSPETVDELSGNAVEYSERELSWEQIARKSIEIYSDS